MLVQLIFNGVTTGAVIALCAVGLSLVSGILKLFNFAQGDFLTVGAYVAFVVNVTLRLSLVWGAVAALVLTAGLAVVLEYVLWRPIRRRGAGPVGMLIVSVGLALILRNVVSWIWGNAPRRYTNDVFQAYSFGSLRVSRSQLVVIVAAALACALVALLLTRTSIGRQMRAMSDNQELSEVAGINTGRVIVFTWMAAGALAGLSGFLQALMQSSFDPNEGVQLLLPIFAAIVLGGIGNAYGALAGGLVIGLAMQVSTWKGFFGGVPTSFTPVVAFAVLIVVLVVRPGGILARGTA